jgi:hypothetical protein
LEYLLTGIFAADILASCFVACFDNGQLVAELPEIRRRYFRGR